MERSECNNLESWCSGKGLLLARYGKAFFDLSNAPSAPARSFFTSKIPRNKPHHPIFIAAGVDYRFPIWSRGTVFRIQVQVKDLSSSGERAEFEILTSPVTQHARPKVCFKMYRRFYNSFKTFAPI
jgi:hypothetical protein